MSIFGIRTSKSSGDIDTLTTHIRDIHKRIRPITDLDKRVSEFQQSVHDSRNTMLEQINTQADRLNQLQDRVRDLTINNRLLRNNVDKIKDTNVITIFAESKGPLVENEVFSFGNGGRQIDTGYVLTRRGQILEMGLVSRRVGGDVTVAISIDGKILPFCETTVHNTLSTYEVFQTPFVVEAGSVIDFVTKTANSTTENTVASLLIELF